MISIGRLGVGAEGYYLEAVAEGDLYRDLVGRLQPSTVLKVHLVARAALARALKWGWIDRNPAADAQPPSARRSKITTPSRRRARA